MPNVPFFSDGLFAKVTEFAGHLPTAECEIFVANFGGAMGRVPADAAAFAGRGADFIMNVRTRWQEAQDDARCIGWARKFYDATRPYASGTEYVNFLSEDESERLSRTYDGNFARLSQIKAKYDPGNTFRVNQNVRP